MSITPNTFATEKVKYGDLSALSLLDADNYVGFAQRYPDLVNKSYIMSAEGQPGVLQRSKTRNYKTWVRDNKPHGSFKVVSDASAVAGSTVTVKLTPDSHTGGGKYSPVAPGMIFENLADGLHYEVLAVTKTTDGEHEAELSVATSATIAPSVTASTAFFQSMGRPSVREDSYQQEGEYTAWTSVERTMTIIRANKKYTDSVAFETLPINGQSYKVWDLPDLDRRFIDQQEFRLMFGPQYANLKNAGNENTDFQGLIPLIKSEGSTITPTGGVLSDAYFEDMRRAQSANGYGREFDALVDVEFSIALQNYFENKTGMNGAVSYGSLSEGDIRLNFDFAKEINYYGLKIGVKEYEFFNRALTHGADPGTGVWAGSALYIPKRSYMVNGDNVKAFSIKYMSESEVGGVVTTLTDGGLVGKNTQMNAEFAHVAHKSIDVPNPLEFIWSKFSF